LTAGPAAGEACTTAAPQAAVLAAGAPLPLALPLLPPLGTCQAAGGSRVGFVVGAADTVGGLCVETACREGGSGAGPPPASARASLPCGESSGQRPAGKGKWQRRWEAGQPSKRSWRRRGTWRISAWGDSFCLPYCIAL
jgi:hypothetical protein